MCHLFLIQAHSAIKCRKMFAFATISVIILPKDIAFLYHDIPFVYITIIMRFYIPIYHLLRLSWHHYNTEHLRT